jgi:protein-tyrosine-phosphatase/predicted ATP-grasp superfamily ATP-dependent carboligase
MDSAPAAYAHHPYAHAAPVSARAIITEDRIHGRALVLGDDTRSFLATVRSLGRAGIIVHAAPGNFRAPALSSRYISAIHRLPAWTGDGTAWLDALEALLRTENYDAIFPCNETSLLPLRHHRARFAPLARLAMPHDEAIDVLFDKHATRTLAQRLRIPVAPGRLLRPSEDAADILHEFGAPVVLKPRQSYRLGALHQRGKVRIAHTEQELAALLLQLPPDLTVLEAFYPGQGVGLSVLAHEGAVLQTFQHQRVHETDGVSFYRASAAPDPALAAAAMAVAAALRLTGIAMFEFKRAADGRWTLLEVNARPWGSLPLPTALGVDFIARWHKLLVTGTVTPMVPYRAGIHARNLFPDIRATLADAKRRPSAAGRLSHLAARFWDLRRLLSGREVQDVLVADDPRPAWAELRYALADSRPRVAGRLPLHARLAASRARHAVQSAWQSGGAILFICQGNICRSPLAEAALRRHLGAADRIRSAGMLPLPGRPAPALAVQAAARLGLDLGPHRSQLLTATMAAGAALLVVFDSTNRRSVLDQFPDAAPKLVRLGDLVGAGDIADPVDGDATVFDATYGVIERAVAAIGELRA